MTLKHPYGPQGRTGDLATAPLFSLETSAIPRYMTGENVNSVSISLQPGMTLSGRVSF